MGFVADAIRLVRKEINIPLVGFAAAPFTLCSYMVEGGKSREFKITKLMMYEATDVWELLMDKVCTMLVDYLKMQVSAGAQALQIFDSWVGCLSPSDYEKYVLPYSKRVFDGLKDFGVPVINFSTGIRQSHFTTGHSIVNKPVHLLYIFMVDILFRIKALDFPCDFNREIFIRSEAFNEIDS